MFMAIVSLHCAVGLLGLQQNRQRMAGWQRVAGWQRMAERQRTAGRQRMAGWQSMAGWQLTHMDTDTPHNDLQLFISGGNR